MIPWPCFQVCVFSVRSSFSFLFEVWGICQNLFHACPLGAGSTLMMGDHTVEGGKRERPTAMASARDPRAKASTRARGATALRWWVSIPGPVGTPIKGHGRKASGMALELKTRASGFTKVSGHMDLRGATVCGRAREQAASTRVHGTTDYRMDMERRRTLMEVRF